MNQLSTSASSDLPVLECTSIGLETQCSLTELQCAENINSILNPSSAETTREASNVEVTGLTYELKSSSTAEFISYHGSRTSMVEESDGLLGISNIPNGAYPFCTPSTSSWANNKRTLSDADLDETSHGAYGILDDNESNSEAPESVRCDDFSNDANRLKTCLVCDDASSGYHYGVSSCEACKAFFKRTIQGNIEYACPANGACVIDKRRRKACQACRYKKCIDVGMLKEGVRLDRVRGGRQKYRRTNNGGAYMSVPNQTGYRKSGSSSELNQLLSTLIACEPEQQLANVADQPDTTDKLQAVLCDLADRDLIGIIGWAKQIPGFPELPLNDQMHLLQTTWCEILLFSLCVRSVDAHQRVLLFTKDFSLTETMANEARIIDVHSRACRLIETLTEVRITREEFVLLKCIILLNGGCTLESVSARNSLRENIVQSLHQYLNGGVRSCHLMLLLPHVRQLDMLAKQFFSMIKNEGKIGMQKLFMEMLEFAQPL